MKNFRNFICFIMAAVLVALPLNAAAVSSDNDALGVCVVSDVHLESASLKPEETVPENDGDLYYRTGIQGQMEYESEAIVRSFMRSFKALDEDILLVCGDITNGNINDHRAAAAMFSDLEANGKQVFVINGNHDVTKPERDNATSAEAFAQIYAKFGFDEAVNRDGNSLSYTAKLSEGCRLLAIDSCIYGQDKGEITDSTMEWIDGQIAAAKADGVKLIAMMHHSLLPHMGAYSITGMEAKGSEKLAKKLAQGDVKFVFSGHFHANDITVAQPAKDKNIYDIMTGSLITYPNAYRIVSFSGEKTQIKTDYVKTIDTRYLPESFTATQKNAITEDFRAYSKGYLFAGIKKWIESYLGSANKICKTLKIDRDSAVGKKLDELMPNISNSLTMPIYGESGSLDAVARLSGNSIPESEYTSAAQLAATILCGIYSGDETIGKDSVEVKVLFSVLRAAVANAIGGMLPSIISSPKLLSTLFYTASGVDSITMAIASPILDAVVGDAYAPGDLNVEIEGLEANGTAKGGAPVSFFQKLLSFFKALLSIVFRLLIK